MIGCKTDRIFTHLIGYKKDKTTPALNSIDTETTLLRIFLMLWSRKHMLLPFTSPQMASKPTRHSRHAGAGLTIKCFYLLITLTILTQCETIVCRQNARFDNNEWHTVSKTKLFALSRQNVVTNLDAP